MSILFTTSNTFNVDIDITLNGVTIATLKKSKDNRGCTNKWIVTMGKTKKVFHAKDFKYSSKKTKLAISKWIESNTPKKEDSKTEKLTMIGDYESKIPWQVKMYQYRLQERAAKKAKRKQ